MFFLMRFLPIIFGNITPKTSKSRRGGTCFVIAMQANKRDSVPLAGRLSFL